MTMVLRQRAIQADLMRWDDSRGHYVLTGTGRCRISTRSRVPGAVVRFKIIADRYRNRRRRFGLRFFLIAAIYNKELQLP